MTAPPKIQERLRRMKTNSLRVIERGRLALVERVIRLGAPQVRVPNRWDFVR